MQAAKHPSTELAPVMRTAPDAPMLAIVVNVHPSKAEMPKHALL